MKKKLESITIEEYQERFDQYYDRAKSLPEDCKSLETLQKRLSSIGFEAGNTYNINSHAHQPDYQLRIAIFLKFDEYLKQLKSEFKASLGKKTSSCKFHVKKDPHSSENKDKFQDTLNF